MKTSEWNITILIKAIPLVSIIMLFVWAFGSNANHNKSNWAKAALVWVAIAIVLNLIFGAIFGTALFMAGSARGM